MERKSIRNQVGNLVGGCFHSASESENTDDIRVFHRSVGIEKPVRAAIASEIRKIIAKAPCPKTVRKIRRAFDAGLYHGDMNGRLRQENTHALTERLPQSDRRVFMTPAVFERNIGKLNLIREPR